MSLKDDINKVNQKEEDALIELEKDFAEFQSKQEEDRQKFLEEQEMVLVEKARKLQERDAKIRLDAQSKIDRLIEDIDRLVEADKSDSSENNLEQSVRLRNK